MANFKFNNICGPVFSNGNLVFTPDGNSVLAPVGNRITMIDLINNKAMTFPFQNRKNISLVLLSPDAQFLISIDRDGRALIASFTKGVVISHFNFKKPVSAASFSPDGRLLATSQGDTVRLWAAPSLSVACFTALELVAEFFAHRDKVTSLCWDASSRFLATSSNDAMAKIYCVANKRVRVLSGHRSALLGCFFGLQTDQSAFYSLSKMGVLIEWEVDLDEMAGGPVEVKDEVATSRRGDGESKVETKEDGGETKLKAKYAIVKNTFFYENKGKKLKSFAYRHLPPTTSLLLIGLASGSFHLHSLPDFAPLQAISASPHPLTAVALSPSAAWAAIGSPALGQLLVWEWRSETAVLRQQGHASGAECAAFAPDGKLFASGGGDGAVKLWNAASGFCFAAFREHSGPVSAVAWAPGGAALLSAGRDGAVWAYDLVRYRSFRVLRPEAGTSAQLTSLAVDPSGKVVAAGSVEGKVFVWALQTAKVTDVLGGHTGPVSAVAFDDVTGVLASVSWDQTLRVWDLFGSKGHAEAFDLGSDALAVAFSPNGSVACVCCANGKLQFWDTEAGELTKIIDGKNDILGGRRKGDPRAAKNSTVGRCFGSVAFSPCGKMVLAGGDSKFVCLYDVDTAILLKKFQISQNRSLDGVLNFLNSKNDIANGAASESEESPSDDEPLAPDRSLPGVRSGAHSADRNTKLAAMSKSVAFSATGRQWLAVTSEGVLLYALDSAATFSPFELEMGATPAEIRKAVGAGDFSVAVVMSIKLGEHDVFRFAVESTPLAEIDLVVVSIAAKYLIRFIELLLAQIVTTKKLHFYTIWVNSVAKQRRPFIKENQKALRPVLRSVYKEIKTKTEPFVKLFGLNMSYLRAALMAMDDNNKISLIDNDGAADYEIAEGGDVGVRKTKAFQVVDFLL